MGGTHKQGEQPIALCEAAMVPVAVLQDPEGSMGWSTIWHVDSTAATAAFVKGAPGNPKAQKIVHLSWALACLLGIEVWFGWVKGKANWSDGVSRDFAAGTCYQKQGFPVRPYSADLGCPKEAWHFLPSSAASR